MDNEIDPYDWETQLATECSDLRKQNAELLAALEALLSVYQGFAPWEGEIERQAEAKALSAIAKAKGE